MEAEYQALFIIAHGNSLISWSSRKQNVVAWSCIEAEYRAIAFVGSEVSWITSLLKELRLPWTCPPMILLLRYTINHAF